jgi:hypothetical protein
VNEADRQVILAEKIKAARERLAFLEALAGIPSLTREEIEYALELREGLSNSPAPVKRGPGRPKKAA